MTQLAEQLAATVRPYDEIFRWSENRLMTIFDAPESGVTARVHQIAGWLGDKAKEHSRVSLVEHLDEESTAELIERIELTGQNVVASLG